MHNCWLRQEFIQDKIKIQWMVMGSSINFLLIGCELIYIHWAEGIKADEQLRQADNKRDMTKNREETKTKKHKKNKKSKHVTWCFTPSQPLRL